MPAVNQAEISIVSKPLLLPALAKEVQSYGGPAPFSEPETRAIRDLLAAHNQRVKVTLFMHSFSQLWLSPYGVNTSDPADYAEMVSS